MRNATRYLLVAFSAIGLLNCSDPSRGVQSTRTKLAIAPRFAASASRAAATLSQGGIEFDHVRIVIIRPASDTLKDTTVAFHPGDEARTLELTIAAVPDEVLTATVQYRQATDVLFEGSANVVAVPSSAQSGSITPVDIDVIYTGPGATTAFVAVSPGSGVYPSGSTTQFTATARDANNAAVANTEFVWSVSDPTVASISAAGVVTPLKSRGSVRVRAFATNGVGDSIGVTFAPAATQMRVIQGAAQSGAPGSTLPVPVIVEAIAADGLPAPAGGLTATFTALSGGSISPTTVAFNADGRAQAFPTLGTRPGAIFLYRVTAGSLAPLTFAEITAVGPPTQLVPSGPLTFSMTAGVIPDPLPTLRVADAEGNSVNGVPLKITIQKNGQNVLDPFVVPSDTVGVLPVSAVAPNVAGTYTVTIESGTAAATFPSLTYTITIEPGAATKLAFKQQPTDVQAGVAVSPAIQVSIQDKFGNIVTSASNTISLSLDPATIGNPPTTAITGQGSVNAVNGVATFSSVKFSAARTGVKIIAAGANLPQIFSTVFNITP